MKKTLKSIFKIFKSLDFIFFGKEKVIDESLSTAFYPRKNYFFEKQMI
tara:strand:- start:233 stop:376 length:144 start_codon:yes stop_codon:yes gene_type:complete